MNRATTPLLAGAVPAPASVGTAGAQSVGPLGDVRVPSADVASQGTTFFRSVDQSQLAARVGVTVRSSTRLEVGNRPLGPAFLTAKPCAGQDRPVRVPVSSDGPGVAWASWTDFAWVAKRPGVTNRQAEFAVAAGGVESIAPAIRAEQALGGSKDHRSNLKGAP